jgi:hypothetical protein
MKKRIDKITPAGKVTIHDIKILPTTRKSMETIPRAKPIKLRMCKNN